MYVCVYVHEALGTVPDTKEALAMLVLSYGVTEELTMHTYTKLSAGC